MNWETLLSLGDSITIGSRSYLGYPEYCGNFLSNETKKNWNVINHAVAGYTTIDLCRSIDKVYFNLKNAKPDIGTILVGTNDLKSKTSPKIFKISYEQLVTKLRLILGNNNIILIEIPKLINGVMLPYTIGMNELVEEYNKIIFSIAQENGLMYVKLEYKADLFFDGVHLNELGSEVVGKQISNYILKLRMI
jgi:lysophospholipase L1-like esterase